MSAPAKVRYYSQYKDFVAWNQEKEPTHYMVMLIKANEAPTWRNVCAAIFSWLTLAGYVVLPGTFTSLKNSEALGHSKSGKIVQDTVQNIPLLPLAALLFILGMAGSAWLWWTSEKNYVWQIRQIYFPGLANSFVGLLTTIVNVMAHNKHWSVIAKVTIIVVGVCTMTMSALVIGYSWHLEKIKTPQDRELARRKESTESI